MELAVIGCGYVGLVSGACLASLGHRVIGVDTDAERIAQLQAGRVPIYEPGLAELIAAQTRQKRLRFTTDTTSAVHAAGVVFIAVGTPPSDHGGADLTMLFAVVDQVIQAANGPKTLVIKSTVPPGTGEQIAARVASCRHPLEVVSNPEFLREGAAVQDFLQPDRIVFGANSQAGLEILRELYQPLIDHGYAIFSMSRQSAELTKFAANAMLAMRVSFINEISLLASAVGADIESVRVGIGADHRIGPAFLKAGVGYGGSCFPKDVAALAYRMRQANLEPHLLDSIAKVNARQKALFAQRIIETLRGLDHPRVAVWGLAFKPDTDDMREAPSLDVLRHLLTAGLTISAYDPQAMDNARRILGERVQWQRDVCACTRGADAIALLTDWPVFITQNWEHIATLMRGRHVFDGRNCLASGKVAAAGLHYHAVGRPPVAPGAGRQGAMGVIPAG